MKIAKRFTFDAAHRLTSLPESHKCHRLHGHTYEVELQLDGPVGAHGFVVDYQDIADAWAPIHDALDHRYLNEVLGLEVPSTENLVLWIWSRLDATDIARHIAAIRVSESSSTWAELTRSRRLMDIERARDRTLMYRGM